MLEYTRKYAEKHKGTISPQQPHSSLFFFECQLQHKFMLSHQQIINNKWCPTCHKISNKLKKKLKKENLTLLSHKGGKKIAERLRQAMAPEVEALADFFEREMVKERVDDEVRERRNLEKSFQSWSRKTSTGGLEESIHFIFF